MLCRRGRWRRTRCALGCSFPAISTLSSPKSASPPWSCWSGSATRSFIRATRPVAASRWRTAASTTTAPRRSAVRAQFLRLRLCRRAFRQLRSPRAQQFRRDRADRARSKRFAPAPMRWSSSCTTSKRSDAFPWAKFPHRVGPAQQLRHAAPAQACARPPNCTSLSSPSRWISCPRSRESSLLRPRARMNAAVSAEPSRSSRRWYPSRWATTR